MSRPANACGASPSASLCMPVNAHKSEAVPAKSSRHCDIRSGVAKILLQA
jgi:hypothetical protein